MSCNPNFIRTLFLCIALLCLPQRSAGVAVRRLPLEHVYCDEERAAQRSDAGIFGVFSDTTVIPSMVAKARCKGAGCPPLDGRRVVIEESRWSSVNFKPVFVEETSGWYFFYLDEERTLPLRPSDAERRTLHSGEVGYLKSECGYIVYDAAPT